MYRVSSNSHVTVYFRIPVFAGIEAVNDQILDSNHRAMQPLSEFHNLSGDSFPAR